YTHWAKKMRGILLSLPPHPCTTPVRGAPLRRIRSPALMRRPSRDGDPLFPEERPPGVGDVKPCHTLGCFGIPRRDGAVHRLVFRADLVGAARPFHRDHLAVLDVLAKLAQNVVQPAILAHTVEEVVEPGMDPRRSLKIARG